MRIAIIGTRGIPNNYGGFEQFAEYLSVGLKDKGHDVFVYNSHDHPYKEKNWNGVNIIHQFDPEYKVGTAGQFIYDLNCILDSRKRSFDIILQLGYTSSSIWNFIFPKKSIVVTNMDGLEWKRTKYGKMTQKFLRYAEALAVKKSNYLVADSIGIKNYLYDTYSVDSEYIPYGAKEFNNPNENILKNYDLQKYSYDLLIARLEPENSLEMILDGRQSSYITRPFLVIGNTKTKFGSYLVNKYKDNAQIRFLNSIYDISVLNNLRYFSNLYFHGHTVGGTNPSLLEAMASNALIAANENEFNSSILGKDAYYFKDSKEVKQILESIKKNDFEKPKVISNIEKIRSLYSWDIIIDSYEKFFISKIKI